MNTLPVPKEEIQLQVRLASSYESCFPWFSKVIKLLGKDKKNIQQDLSSGKDVRTRFLLFTKSFHEMATACDHKWRTKWHDLLIALLLPPTILTSCSSNIVFVGPLRFGDHSFSLAICWFFSLLLAEDKKRRLLHNKSFSIHNSSPSFLFYNLRS
jgi:hypothetical protein